MSAALIVVPLSSIICADEEKPRTALNIQICDREYK